MVRNSTTATQNKIFAASYRGKWKQVGLTCLYSFCKYLLCCNQVILTTNCCMQQVWRWMFLVETDHFKPWTFTKLKKKNQTRTIPIKSSQSCFSSCSGNKLVSVLIFLLAEPIHSWPLQASLSHLIEN